MSHVWDNTDLYVQLLKGMLTGKDYGYGKNGYYLAASGSVAWDDFYAEVAKALKKRGLVQDDQVHDASPSDLEIMGTAIGCPAAFVRIQMGGK